MRVLFLAGGSASTVYGLTPLATAVRDAGHEVVMASTAEMMPAVIGVGLPALATTTATRKDFMTGPDGGPVAEMPTDPAEQMALVGSWYANMALAGMDVLCGFADSWRPDVVLGGTLAYAAPLVAARSGVPWVRQFWDTLEATGYDVGARARLAPYLAEVGLPGLPEPAYSIDVTPPSLRDPDGPDARPMRFVPANGQRVLEPWMYTRRARTRICVTAGSRVSQDEELGVLGINPDRLRHLVRDTDAADVEVIVAAPEEIAEVLRPELPELRIGWVPLDVLAPTCDLFVHNDGGVTSLVAMNAGVPQLSIPKLASAVGPAVRLADHGAGITLLDDDPAARLTACEHLLNDPTYRARSGALAAEIAAQPTPARHVEHLEALCPN